MDKFDMVQKAALIVGVVSRTLGIKKRLPVAELRQDVVLRYGNEGGEIFDKALDRSGFFIVLADEVVLSQRGASVYELVASKVAEKKLSDGKMLTITITKEEAEKVKNASTDIPG